MFPQIYNDGLRTVTTYGFDNSDKINMVNIELTPKEYAEILFRRYMVHNLDKTISTSGTKIVCKNIIQEILIAQEKMWDGIKDFVDKRIDMPQYNQSQYYHFNQSVIKEIDKL